MRIEYIKLKNYVSIYSALKVYEVSLNLTKMKNKIILITGPNGTGKTSLLSTLHPFATNGNLDVRSNESLILDKKEGYKEIHIRNNDDLFIIKHYYNPNKDTHSIKSFIEKNGEELNSNGNVTSFKEIIKDELDIEMDYLKLIRLGDNVVNFIDLKTTERKSYMGKFLEEVDIYLFYFKKINTKIREMKSIISHLIFKKDKLNIEDIEKSLKELKLLDKEVKKYNEEINKINDRININKYEISKYEDIYKIKDSLDSKEKELEKIKKSISKMKDIDNNIDEDKCKDKILSIQKNITENEFKLKSYIQKRDDSIIRLDSLLYEKTELDKELNKLNNDKNLIELEYMISDLKSTIEKRSKASNLASYEYKYSKAELEELIISLDILNDTVVDIYSVNKRIIKKVADYIGSNKDIDSYLKTNEEKNKKNYLRTCCEVVMSAFDKKYKNNSFLECSHTTSLGNRFYDFVFNIVTMEPDRHIDTEEDIAYFKMTYSNIMKIFNRLKSFNDLISKLPDKIKLELDANMILDRMVRLDKFYNKELLYNELTRVTEYEINDKDINKLKELVEKHKLLKASLGNSDYLNKRKDELLCSIEEMNENIEKYSNKIKNINNLLDKEKEDLENYMDLKVSLENKEYVESSYLEYKEIYDKLISLVKETKISIDELSNLIFYRDKYLKEYNDLDSRLNFFNEYTNELKTYNEDFDELELIKKSLSSKEGIPLLYIDLYFKDILDIANDLLDIIYDGKLYLDEFNITADEFSIPYSKSNISGIKDVCYASQGEKSFISLSLSFALIYKSITKYNIMLLDEIDSTLDTNNRSMFIKLLEEQQEKINSEQIFLISHNNMFDMYPVDIINMKNEKNYDNNMSNYIELEY